MASVKTDLGYIHGTENLIQWVNENSNTYQIKNHGDLYYWVKLAKQKKRVADALPSLHLRARTAKTTCCPSASSVAT